MAASSLASTLTRYDVGCGRALRLRQYFFERGPPVAQPAGSRANVDGTGLKIWPTAMPLLLHLQQLLSGHSARLRVPRRTSAPASFPPCLPFAGVPGARSYQLWVSAGRSARAR